LPREGVVEHCMLACIWRRKSIGNLSGFGSTVKRNKREVPNTRFEPMTYGLALDLLVVSSSPVVVPTMSIRNVHQEIHLSTMALPRLIH
jgi:hypothetical protein